jgi:hypothetical protein
LARMVLSIGIWARSHSCEMWSQGGAPVLALRSVGFPTVLPQTGQAPLRASGSPSRPWLKQQPGVPASSAASWGLVPHVRFHWHRQLCRPSPCVWLSHTPSTTAAPPQGASSVPSPPSCSTSSMNTPWFPGSDRPLSPQRRVGQPHTWPMPR